MPDNLTPDDRKRTMRAVKSKRTGLERQLHAMLAGARLSGWCLNCEEVLGKPDVVFLKQKVAVFVDGCFWHGCPHCNRPLPETNREYWERKIQRNVNRDRRYNRELTDAGWCVLRIWEHQLKDKNEREALREKLIAALEDTSARVET